MFSNGPFRTWIDMADVSASLERSLREIMEVVETHGPYDGMWR